MCLGRAFVLLGVASVMGCSSSSIATGRLFDNTANVSEAPVVATANIVDSLGRAEDAVAVGIDQFLNVYVLDRTGSELTKYSIRGDSLRTVRGKGREAYQFSLPDDVDTRLTNRVYVADEANERVEIFSGDLTYITSLDLSGSSPSTSSLDSRVAGSAQELRRPVAARVDNAGNLFVIDDARHLLLKYRSDLSFEREIGSYSAGASARGVLTDPERLVVDGNENLCVLDGDRALRTYDNFGNSIASSQLQPSMLSCGLAVQADTAYLLRAAKGRLVICLYHLPDLQETGRVEVAPSSTWLGKEDTPTGLAVRGGIILLLTRSKAYRLVLVHEH